MISPALHQWTTWVSALCHQHCQSPAADCVSVTPQRRSHELRWTPRASITPITLVQLAADKARACLSNKASSSKSWKKPGTTRAMQNWNKASFWMKWLQQKPICMRRWQKTRREERKRCLFYIEHPKHRASIPNTRKKTAQSSHHVNSLCIIRCLILLERSGFIKSIEGIFSSIDRTVMSWQFKGKAMSWPMGLPVPFIIFPCFIIFDHLKAGCQAVKCSL